MVADQRISARSSSHVISTETSLLMSYQCQSKGPIFIHTDPGTSISAIRSMYCRHRYDHELDKIPSAETKEGRQPHTLVISCAVSMKKQVTIASQRQLCSRYT